MLLSGGQLPLHPSEDGTGTVEGDWTPEVYVFLYPNPPWECRWAGFGLEIGPLFISQDRSGFQVPPFSVGAQPR